MPFNLLDPYGDLGYDQQTQAPSRIKPLNKPEEESLLSKLGGTVLGGIGYVGGALGKPGRAVRGLLGGKPEEALSLIPFSDALGITDERNAVSGEDLLKNVGILSGPGEKGTFEARDLAGPALEMALDPLSWLSLGGSAVTKAGSVARKVGIAPTTGAARAATTLGDLTTTKNIGQLGQMTARNAAVENALRKSGLTTAETLGEKLGGNIGVGLPFGHNAFTADVTPAIKAVGNAASYLPGAGLVSKAAGAIGNVVKPAAYSVASLFHQPWQGATDELGRQTGVAFTNNVRAADVARETLAAHTKRVAHEFGLLNPQGGDEISAALENVLVGPQRKGVGDVVDIIRQYEADQLAKGNAAGLNFNELVDEIVGHRGRQQTQLLKDSPGKVGPMRSQATPTYTSAMAGRNPAFKNLVGGTTHGINPMLANPEYSGIAATTPKPQLENRIMQNAAAMRRDPTLINMPAEEEALLGTLPKDIGVLQGLQEQAVQGGNQAAADAIKGLIEQRGGELSRVKGRFDQSYDLARIAANVDPQYAQRAGEGIRFFGNHPIEDTFRLGASKDRAIAGADAITELFAKTAGGPVPGGVGLNDAMAQLGLDNLPVAQKNIMEAMGARAPLTPDDYLKLQVPQEAMKTAQRLRTPWTAPEQLRPALDVIDTLTNLFKAGTYSLWPASHVRNAVGADVLNLAKGALSTGSEARAALSGGVIPNAASKLPELAGLSDREATNRLMELAAAHLGLGKSFSQAAEATGPAAEMALAKQVPGMSPTSWKDIAANAIPKDTQDLKDLLKIRGVGGYTQTVSKPVQTGVAVGEKVEAQKRLSGWLKLLDQGYTPEAAAQTILAAHGDFSKLTGFERGVMRRLVPFYSWQRQVGPEIVKEIAQKPGGVLAQSIHASNAFRQQAGFVPPYLGQGLAIPVGEEDNGQRRYLSSLGLPQEQVLDLLKTGPHGLENTLMGLLGQMNPLIKGPLEYATGKQFFTGRDLQDLHDVTGGDGNVGLSQAVMNSPLSRFYTSGRTLLDERKDLPTKLLNLLTGVKLSDVDVEKQRGIASRDLVNELLTGEPGVKKFTQLYVKPEDLPNLSPRDVALLRLQATMEQEGKQRAKQQKIGVQR